MFEARGDGMTAKVLDEASACLRVADARAAVAPIVLKEEAEDEGERSCEDGKTRRLSCAKMW